MGSCEIKGQEVYRRRIHVTPEAMQARQDDLVSRLETGVDAIQTSDDFKRFLDAQALFYNYSFGNTMLIVSQLPEARSVNSYKRWQALGRQVRKGEKGIKIWVPHTRKKTDGDIDEGKELTGYGIGNAFDISQTDGKPLPKRTWVELEGDEGKTLFDDLRKVATDQEELNFEVWPRDKDMPIPGARGFYQRSSNLVVVREGSYNQKAETSAHELGHHFGGDDEETTIASRPHEETMAGAVSYIVSGYFGVDVSDSNFEYVAQWAKDRKVLQESLNRIQKVSKYIITSVSKLHNAADGPNEPIDVYTTPTQPTSVI